VPAPISCIVPVHNGERHLAAALDSILAQDYEPLEILVVDDGSTDRSAAIAESYGGPVNVVHQLQAGPAAARNRGIVDSRGAYLAFLDADDLYRPGKLAAQMAHLEENPGVDLCLCVGQNFWEEGLDGERIRYEAAGRLRATHTFGTLLAHRSVFARVGLLDGTRPFGEQVDWFLRADDLALAVGVVDEIFLDRRMHAESRTHGADVMGSYFDLVSLRIAQQRS
jgi:glycosyltransferase involved in cell wall biosynthesis